MKRCLLCIIGFVMILAFCFSASAVTEFVPDDFAIWVNTPVAETLNTFLPDGNAETDQLLVPDIVFSGFSGSLRFNSPDGELWDKLFWYCDGGLKDTMLVIRNNIESAGANYLRNGTLDVRGVESVYEIGGHVIHLGYTDENGSVTYVYICRTETADEVSANSGDKTVLPADIIPDVSIPVSITDPVFGPDYVRSEVPNAFPSNSEDPAEEPAVSAPEQDPGTVSEPAAETAFDVDEWVGYWSTRDDSMSEMVISSKGDGKLYVEASFLRTLKMNGRLTPGPDGGMRFESEGGALNGTVIRTGDWMFDLTFTDGDSFNDEEASEYNAYFARTFRYEITPYDQMYYEEAFDTVNASEDDWIAVWKAEKANRVSTLNVTRVNGALFMDVELGNEYRFSGSLEKSEGNTLYFSSENFWCDLTLIRKQGIIVMDEVGSSLDGVYDWLEPFSFNIVEYHWAESQPDGSESNSPDGGTSGDYLTVRDLCYWVEADTDLLLKTLGAPSMDFGKQFVINNISFYGYNGYLNCFRVDDHHLDKLYWCMDDGSWELLLEICNWIEEAGGKLLRTDAPDYAVEYVYDLDGRFVYAGHTDDGGPMTYVYVCNTRHD